MQILAAISLLLLATLAVGQDVAPTPTPSPTPNPIAGAINFSANFSNFGSVASVNGNSNVTANIYSTWFPITGSTGKFRNVAGRLDAIQMPGQSTSIYLLGLEKSWQGKKLPGFAIDWSQYQIAAFAEAGGKRQDTTKLSAFSARAGIALRRKLTNVIGINLGEFSYLRTNIGTPTSTGVVLFSGPNNWTAGAGITLSLAAPKPTTQTQ